MRHQHGEWLRGDFRISSTLFFKAAFLAKRSAIGTRLSTGLSLTGSEAWEPGSVDRTAVLAGDQLQFGDAVLAKCVADPRRCALPPASRLRWIEQSLKFISLDSVWLPGALEWRSRTTWPGFLSSARRRRLQARGWQDWRRGR